MYCFRHTIWLVIFKGSIFCVFSKVSLEANIREYNYCSWQLVNFLTLGSTAVASNTRLIVKNGVIDKDSGFFTGLKIVVRAR